MTRSILLSLVVIGAVVSLVAGAGTFAVFTDQKTGTAEVNTGTISLYLSDSSDDSGANEALFEGLENMVPGETVSQGIDLFNSGNRAWDVTDVNVTVGGGGACTTSPIVTLTPSFDGNDHDGRLHAEAGETAQGTVSVTLPASAGNDCQNVTFTGSAVVTVTQHFVGP